MEKITAWVHPHPDRSFEGRRQEADWKFLDRFTSVFNTVSAGDVMLFTRTCRCFSTPGFPWTAPWAILIEVTGKDRFKEIIGEILKAVQGAPIFRRLSRYPKVFSTFYVNMIRAGETGGVLARCGAARMFLEGAQDLRDFVRSPWSTPCFSSQFGGLSIIVSHDVRRAEILPVIFADMGDAIPFTTMLLIGFTTPPFLVVPSSWSFVLLYVLLVRYPGPQGKQLFDQSNCAFRQRDLVRKIEVARFFPDPGNAHPKRCSDPPGLTLVRDIIRKPGHLPPLEMVNNRVKEGDRLSKALNDLNLFPSLAVQMITVGEETGRLDAMLLRVAENYEKVVRTTVRRFISFLEPAMILFMGVIVGVIVISMLMAIFSMNELPF